MLILILFLCLIGIIAVVFAFFNKKPIKKMPVTPIDEAQHMLESLQFCDGADIAKADLARIIGLYNPIATNEESYRQNAKVTNVTDKYLKYSDCEIGAAKKNTVECECALRIVAEELLFFIKHTRFRPVEKPESFSIQVKDYYTCLKLLLNEATIHDVNYEILEIINFLNRTRGKYAEHHCFSQKNWGTLMTLQLRTENCYAKYLASQDTLERVITEKESVKQIFFLHGIV